MEPKRVLNRPGAAVVRAFGKSTVNRTGKETVRVYAGIAILARPRVNMVDARPYRGGNETAGFNL
jgi:hypothetical protein